MTSMLIVYASRHGHTATIAQRLADRIGSAGVAVTLAEVAEADALDIHDFDGVIAGSAIHMERHDHRLVAWACRHSTLLNTRPTGFFSVSLAAADGSAEGRATTREYIDRFLDDTGWIPTRTIALAGALQYREYGFLTRQMIRQIAHREGLSTDMSRDTEYTDWSAVDRFADDCVQALRISRRRDPQPVA